MTAPALPRPPVAPARSRALWLGLAGAVGALAALAPELFLPVVGLAVAAVLLLVEPALALGLLVASRASLDSFAYESFAVPAFLVNPAAALGLGVLALAAGWLALRARTGAPVDWGGRPGLLWGMWLGVGLFGVLVGYLQHGAGGAALGVREWLRLATFGGLYLLAANWADTPRRRRILVRSVVAGLAVPAAVGLYQLLTGDTTHDVFGIRRIAGTFVHPNPFGLYLVTVAVAAWAFARDTRSGGERLVLAGAVGLALLLLVFTYSRSAMGILLVTGIAVALTGSPRQRVVLLVGLAAAVAAATPFLAWRFADLFALNQVSADTNSLAWRFLNYGRLLDAWMDSPVVGHGLKTISLANPTKSTSLEGYTIGFAAHNEALRVLVEQGLVGFLFYATGAVLLLRALRRFRDAQPGRDRGGMPALGNAVFCYTATLLVLSALGTEILSHTVVLFALFTLFGVLRAGSRETGPGP